MNGDDDRDRPQVADDDANDSQEVAPSTGNRALAGSAKQREDAVELSSGWMESRRERSTGRAPTTTTRAVAFASRHVQARSAMQKETTVATSLPMEPVCARNRGTTRIRHAATDTSKNKQGGGKCKQASRNRPCRRDRANVVIDGGLKCKKDGNLEAMTDDSVDRPQRNAERNSGNCMQANIVER